MIPVNPSIIQHSIKGRKYRTVYTIELPEVNHKSQDYCSSYIYTIILGLSFIKIQTVCYYYCLSAIRTGHLIVSNSVMLGFPIHHPRPHSVIPGQRSSRNAPSTLQPWIMEGAMQHSKQVRCCNVNCLSRDIHLHPHPPILNICGANWGSQWKGKASIGTPNLAHDITEWHLRFQMNVTRIAQPAILERM